MKRQTSKSALNKIPLYMLCLFMGCNGSDDPVVNPPVGNQSCLLDNVLTPTLSYKVTRNVLRLPTRIDFTYAGTPTYQSSCTLEYDGANRLIKMGYEDMFYTYEYDANNRVIAEKFDAQPNSPLPFILDTERTFTYNDEGYLDSAYYRADIYERYVYDTQGNVIKRFVKYTGQPEFLINEYLAFDDKKNPYFEFSFSFNVLLSQSGVEGIVTSYNPVRSKNNVLQSKTYSSDGTFTAYNGSFNYNDSGYPTSITGSNISYIYQCE